MKTLAVPRVDRATWLAVALGFVAIVGGGLVATVNSAAPFAHGSWVAAYLVLVGGVAQLALALGGLVLPAGGPSVAAARLRVVCWNAGNAVVITGVLVSLPALVVVGSLPLLAALASFALGVGRGRGDALRWVLTYQLGVAALAVSVAIGCVLAGAGH